MRYSVRMRRLARLLLICCLIGCLPLQGLAAVSMAWCQSLAPASAAAPGVKAMVVPDPSATATATAPARHPCHDAATTTATTATPADLLPDDGDSPPDNHRCASCAVCHAGCALPATWPRLADASPAVNRLPPLARTPATGFITGGPERPPRA